MADGSSQALHRSHLVEYQHLGLREIHLVLGLQDIEELQGAPGHHQDIQELQDISRISRTSPPPLHECSARILQVTQIHSCVW